ncbi:MAG: hypothetical protein K6F51_04790 [Acetatifactor sp.]|nr:hypothetical protein [Acetatifactor sp.]
MKNLVKKMTTGNRPVIITTVLFTATWLFIVLTAWLAGLHLYDFSITISAYIGLRLWTVLLYFCSATIMFVLLTDFVRKTPIPKIKKLTYFIVFLSIWGCSIFPCNESWSATVTQIHQSFAYSLMFSATFSFVLTIFLTKNNAVRVFAISTLLYAIFFIFALLIMRWHWFDQTVFIWEILCIYLLIIELLTERPRASK